MEELKSKTLGSLFWKFLERAGNQCIQLVVQIVMARLLTPEDFGCLAIILVFINIGNIFVQSGLNTALIRAPKIDRLDTSTVFWMSLGVSILLCAALYFTAPYIAAFYGADGLTAPLRALSLVLIVNAFNSVQVAVITRDLNFKRIFYATLISVLVSGGVGIVLAINGGGLWALVLQQLSYQLVNCLALFVQTRWLPSLEFSIDRAKSLYSFGWRLLVSNLLETGYQSLSDLLVGQIFSKAELGYLSQGKKYPNAIASMLDGSIQSVMLSAVARVQDDAAQVKRFVRRALLTSVYCIAPVMVLFALLAEPFVLLVLGDQWIEVVPYLQVYCIICAFRPIHTANLQALNALGRSDLYLRLEIVKKAVSLAFLFFGCFVLKNIYAVLYGYLLSCIIASVINAYPSKSTIGYSYGEQVKDLLPILLILLASCASAVLISMIGIDHALLPVLQTVVFCLMYLLLSKIFKIEEYTYIINTLKEIKKKIINHSK